MNFKCDISLKQLNYLKLAERGIFKARKFCECIESVEMTIINPFEAVQRINGMLHSVDCLEAK